MGPCFRMLSQGRRERMQLSNGCPVIASASEAIHLCRKESMDCFVAYAPRNDVALIPHTPSSSRREAPEAFLLSSAPLEGVGNAGCPLHPRPRVHLVVIERTRATTSTPESPGIPARNGFNGFLRALPGDRALLPPSLTDMFCLSPVGPTQLRELDASVGASGPHDFAVRNNISRPPALQSLTDSKNPPCNRLARKTLPRPPHSTPRP